ncbi:MAG: DUF4126 domain-containing protein [Candidatus Auribacterota bacterium]|jgi:hypothetical protein|nr:DUF4126 domain-containing protein [Candidatus Auribacterota bacterium]
MVDSINNLAVLLGSSWGSGVNLYLTIAGLGIAHRLQWTTLPGNMDTLAHPIVIAVAVLMYLVEFFADKIPYVDSVWDSIHTLIRPIGGSMMGYMASADIAPAIQIPIAVLTGAIALDSHLTKATARAAINTSPEPVTNSIASVAEDAGVLGALYLTLCHPVILTILVIVFIVFSIWFLVKMFHLVKSVFRKKRTQPSTP